MSKSLIERVMGGESIGAVLTEATGPTWRWKKNDDGSYEAMQGQARLIRKGKDWYLTYGGREHKLGPKATLDDADKLMSKLIN